MMHCVNLKAWHPHSFVLYMQISPSYTPPDDNSFQARLQRVTLMVGQGNYAGAARELESALEGRSVTAEAM